LKILNKKAVSLLGKWYKEIGNAVIAEKKSLNSPLNQRLIDQSIVATAGAKKRPRSSVDRFCPAF
jgi:hypothetical protein